MLVLQLSSWPKRRAWHCASSCSKSRVSIFCNNQYSCQFTHLHFLHVQTCLMKVYFLFIVPSLTILTIY